MRDKFNDLFEDFNSFLEEEGINPRQPVAPQEDYLKFTAPYTHTGASMAKIIATTNQVAKDNPTLEHTTYIVSFPARIVTAVKIKNGQAVCVDKGYVEKKREVI